MLTTDQMRLRRIEKADLWHLWEWHEQDELYLFHSVRPFSTWDWIYNNFENCFSGKGDFIIENSDGTVSGICSYGNIIWKNRSCTISFKMVRKYYRFSCSVEAVQILTSFIFNELNLIKIDSYVEQDCPLKIQILKKTGFHHEGLLREHLFKKNHYLDVHIFSLFTKGHQ